MSEVKFLVDFTLEDEHLRKGMKMWYKEHHRIYNISTLVIGIMCIFPALVYPSIQSCVFFTTAALMFLLIHFKGYLFQADADIKALHKMLGTNENCGKFHYTFYDDMFEMSTKISNRKYMYSQINYISENDNLIIISLDGRNLFFVLKNGVQEDKTQELTDMLKKIVADNKKEEPAPQSKVKMSEIVAKAGEDNQD